MWDIDYYIDIKHFIELINIDNSEFNQIKTDLTNSIDSFIIANKHVDDDNCCGFSSYLPRRAIDYNYALRYSNGVLPSPYEETLFAIESQWDEFLKEFLGIADNQAPNMPTISGEANGGAGQEYEYTFVSTDPDGNGLYYCINWGDGTEEICIGPYESGEEVTYAHTWEEEDTYTIQVKARDIYGAESEWATLEVSMPNTRQIKSTTYIIFLAGKITEIEYNQNNDFRFLPIKVIKFGNETEDGDIFEIMEETQGGYPCCGYIIREQFHGIISQNFIFGIWIIN
jgi:hypothetical protein